MLKEDQRQFKIVVDVKQRRPACVLIQAVAGGNMDIVNMLPSEAWLTAPTDDMRMVVGTKKEWDAFGEQLKERFSNRHKKNPG